MQQRIQFKLLISEQMSASCCTVVSARHVKLVSWILTSLFSTNMAISETKPDMYRRAFGNWSSSSSRRSSSQPNCNVDSAGAVWTMQLCCLRPSDLECSNNRLTCHRLLSCSVANLKLNSLHSIYAVSQKRVPP